MRILRFIALFTLVLVHLCGCGYHVPGSVKAMADIQDKTLDIPLFTNKSYRPNLEAIVTNNLIEEFVRREVYKVVESGAAALSLTGSVTAYSVSALSYTATDAVKEYQATMTVEATLRRSSNQKVMWRGVLTAAQAFPANDNNILQQNSEEAAIREICRRLSREIYININQDF